MRLRRFAQMLTGTRTGVHALPFVSRIAQLGAAGILLASLASVAASQGRQRHVINGGLPAVSPDGQLIAFQALRDTLQPDALFVIRVDGTGERKLTVGGGAPVWYANGSRVMYSGPTGTMSVALDGTGAQPVSISGGRGFAPSPDGKQLVYSAGNPPAVKLVASAPDGSAPRVLVDGPGMSFNGVWSPDGKTIALARIDSTRDMQIWLVNADGSRLRQLTKFAAADGRPQWPSWSPDGKSLAVQSGVYNQQNPASNTAHIWLVDATTGAARKLAPHDKAYLDETPSFFPDGKRIAFQSDRTGRMEIWVMNVDGTGARQVTK